MSTFFFQIQRCFLMFIIFCFMLLRIKLFENVSLIANNLSLMDKNLDSLFLNATINHFGFFLRFVDYLMDLSKAIIDVTNLPLIELILMIIFLIFLDSFWKLQNLLSASAVENIGHFFHSLANKDVLLVFSGLFCVCDRENKLSSLTVG